MDNIRYRELTNMSNTDINNLSAVDKLSIQNEFTQPHTLTGWNRVWLSQSAIKFFTPTTKNYKDIIQSFIRNYTEADVEKYIEDFKVFCLSEQIYQEEFEHWRLEFNEFLADNRTFDVDWTQAALTNRALNLGLISIPNFPFKIQ